MAILFQPLTIRNTTFKNRIIVSPMCQYSARDGYVNDWHFVHLGSRAVGGAALILVEATAVSPEGRITPGDLGIWSDDHIPGLQRINRFLVEHDALPGIQLAHAGRKASHQAPWEGGAALPAEAGGWQTVAPSAIPFKEGSPAPTELDASGIGKVIDDFRAAAERAQAAGFVVAEIHAAHGYLLHEFLSPLSNKRTDEWGGPFENRTRLLFRVVEEVRAVWPQDQPLFVRISATDWTEGGWTPDDSVALAAALKEKGVDLIDCSSGGNVPGARIPTAPLYQVPFAERIKRETGMLTGAVGLITKAEEAEAVLSAGKSDFILLARKVLRDPYFPLKAARELGVDVPWPVQYERAKN